MIDVPPMSCKRRIAVSIVTTPAVPCELNGPVAILTYPSFPVGETSPLTTVSDCPKTARVAPTPVNT